MTEVIHKFMIPVPDGTRSTITMPEGAEVLHTAAQNEIPYLWARVNTDARSVERHFRVLMTGQYIPDEEAQQLAGKYIGTFHTTDGFVGHVFYD